MAEVLPFKGVLYNVSRISRTSGEELLAPPYDIITPELREALYAKSPYNIVKIDFGKGMPEDSPADNRYTRAKTLLDAWLQEGALSVSQKPSFYAYEIAYDIQGSSRTLRGFLGMVRLEQLGKGNIHPHEYTHSKPKKDRLDLMRHCSANTSPIYALYNSPQRTASACLEALSGQKAVIEGRDDSGAVHRLWEISDPAATAAITAELSGKAVFIADGHHRYETALEYQKEMRLKDNPGPDAKPYDYVLMFLANMADEGITILPTHRLVKEVPADILDQLSHDFDIEERRDGFSIPGAISGSRDVYGLYTGGGSWLRLSYRGEGIHGVPQVLKDLDVTILHDLIFKQLLDVESVAYEMDVEKCLAAVRSGEYQAAFFLNPTRVEDVERVALAGLRMPPKSTYFYPKLMTGLVLNVFHYTFS
ncbi:MAG: DUF1015 domain-containing protein [Thermodesulfovibrionales bacterium]